MSINQSVINKFFVGLIAILTLGFYACDKSAEEEEVKTIKLAYANWSEGVAMTNLASVLLEEELGYKVITKMTDVESVFGLLNSGEYDVFVDAWLPHTHGNYMNVYGNDLEDLGINVEQVKTGLMVPEFVDIQSIEELENITENIIGIGSGAGIMNATATALEAYDLSVNLVDGSEQTMTAELIEAIKRREPIVVTGWTPHWVYNRFDLKFLDDPKSIYGESEQIHTIARKNFTNEHVRASLFFERFQLSGEELGELMDEVQSMPGNEKRAVKNWIDKNELVVNKWVRGLQPEREKVM